MFVSLFKRPGKRLSLPSCFIEKIMMFGNNRCRLTLLGCSTLLFWPVLNQVYVEKLIASMDLGRSGLET